MKTKPKRKRKHWYFTEISECVLCGRGKEYRERRYGRKPAKAKRYHFTQFACPEHFI